MKKELHKAYFALGLVSFFWGTTYIASRIGAQHMPGLFVSGLRQFLSGIILVSYFLFGNLNTGGATATLTNVNTVYYILIVVFIAAIADETSVFALKSSVATFV